MSIAAAILEANCSISITKDINVPNMTNQISINDTGIYLTIKDDLVSLPNKTIRAPRIINNLHRTSDGQTATIYLGNDTNPKQSITGLEIDFRKRPVINETIDTFNKATNGILIMECIGEVQEIPRI